MYPFINSIFLTLFDVKAKSVVFMGLRFYKRVFTDTLFWRSMFNTMYLTLISVPITIFIALITAVLMDKMRSRFFRNTLQIASLLPMMMSLIAAALIF
ncbi:MAG: hypothetical protein LBP32_02070, partial [Spirochaetaceae bacterium]|nr:hypothetical protein [Spirochaetaceae bacterium]